MSAPPPGGPPGWGPYGQQPPPPHQGQPGYGPPGQGQPGYTQPGYGQPPPGPPRKSRVLPVLAAVGAMVVLVVVGLGVGLLVFGGGDGDEGADPSPAPTTSAPTTTDSTSPTPTDPTSEPTESTSVPPGPRFEGTGYSIPQLDEWNDVTRTVRKQNPGVPIDLVVAWGSSLTSGRANFLVDVTSSFGQTEPGPLQQQWRDNLVSGLTDVEVTKVDAPDVGGSPTIGVQLESTNQNGIAIIQTAYLAVHDGQAFSIAFSRTSDDPDAQDALPDLVQGWAWTG